MKIRTGQILAVAAALALTACGDQGESEGRSILERAQLARGGPDEFLVIERRPLETPPDLRALPPPDPGAPSRVEPRPEDTIIQIFSGPDGQPVPASVDSPGQRAIMEITAAEGIAGIREQIARDNRTSEDREETIPEILLGDILADPASAERLDPVAELQRLRREYPDVQVPTAPRAASDG